MTSTKSHIKKKKKEKKKEEKSDSDTTNSTMSNAKRSSSLPLKIMLSNNNIRSRDCLVKSWTNPSIIHNTNNNKINTRNITGDNISSSVRSSNTNINDRSTLSFGGLRRYNFQALSASEYFLKLIEEETTSPSQIHKNFDPNSKPNSIDQSQQQLINAHVQNDLQNKWRQLLDKLVDIVSSSSSSEKSQLAQQLQIKSKANKDHPVDQQQDFISKSEQQQLNKEEKEEERKEKQNDDENEKKEREKMVREVLDSLVARVEEQQSQKQKETPSSSLPHVQPEVQFESEPVDAETEIQPSSSSKLLLLDSISIDNTSNLSAISMNDESSIGYYSQSSNSCLTTTTQSVDEETLDTRTTNKTVTLNSSSSSSSSSVVEIDSVNNSTLIQQQQSSAELSVNSTTSSSSTSNIDEEKEENGEEEEDFYEEEEIEYRKFLRKKSCLTKKPKLFIDVNKHPHHHHHNHHHSHSQEEHQQEQHSTSSPVLSTSPQVSPSSHFSLLSLLNNPKQQQQQQTQQKSPEQQQQKNKRRLFWADSCGKELFVVRTMQEPSNCPPKLTSKIVQYFLNSEFKQTERRLNQMQAHYSHHSHNHNNNHYHSHSHNHHNHHPSYHNNNSSANRNYNYDITGFNYPTTSQIGNGNSGSNNNTSNGNSSLKGSIAFYSLNFSQPAACDYAAFQSRIDEKFVSLENVMLNSFKINGTIKVKNVHFQKQVFVRCSYDGWQTYHDVPANYVNDSSSSSVSLGASPPASSMFYGSPIAYRPLAAPHRDHDTFRFEFQLPKTVRNPDTPDSSPVCSRQSRNNITASIQFCICYKSGENTEHWDNNFEKNYEILQYVIDINEKTAAAAAKKNSLAAATSANKNNNTNPNFASTSPIRKKAGTNFFKFDIKNYSNNGKYGGSSQEIYY